MRARLLTLLLLTTSLACGPAASLEPGLSRAPPPPDGPVESDVVTAQVTRTRALTLESKDGVLRVTVPALSVDTTTTLVLAKLRPDLVPGPRVGAGYILRVTEGALLAPARVEWRVGPDVTVPVRELRIATTDATEALVPLPAAQAGANVVAAQVDGAATLLLVDRRAHGGVTFAADLPGHSGGDALLWRGDLDGARAAYHAARQAGPNASAALGRALTDLLLLMKKPPVSDLLLRCGLQQDTLLQAVVGSGGVLAQAAEDRAGLGALQIEDVGGSQTLLADEAYARAVDGNVQLTMRGAGFELLLTLPPGELPVGERLERSRLPGVELVLISRGDRFQWPAGAPGTMTVFQRGTAVGGRLHLMLSNVRLSGAPGEVTITTGELQDTLTTAPALVHSLGVVALDGPPLVPVLSQLIGGCTPDVTATWIVDNAAALADRLAPIGADLAEAAASEEQGALLVAPSGLTRLPRNVPITARDAQLLSSAVALARAGLTAVAAYHYAGLNSDFAPHPVGYWIDGEGSLHQLNEDGEIVVVHAVVLNHPMLSEELNAQLLLPRRGSVDLLKEDLAPARVLLEAGLGELRTALLRPGPGGVVRWAALESAGLVDLLLDVVEATQASLPTGTAAVPLTAMPGFAMNLSRLFDDPLTHDRLLTANGGRALTTVFPGAPQGRTPHARDRRLAWQDTGFSDALWESFMELPSAPSPRTCMEGEVCADGFACTPDAVGTCSLAATVCQDDVGCPVGERCVLPHRCRRAAPNGLRVLDLRGVLAGPDAPGLHPWLWHLWQPLFGADPARPAPVTR